jgi:hypothetical protein
MKAIRSGQVDSAFPLDRGAQIRAVGIADVEHLQGDAGDVGRASLAIVRDPIAPRRTCVRGEG